MHKKLYFITLILVIVLLISKHTLEDKQKQHIKNNKKLTYHSITQQYVKAENKLSNLESNTHSLNLHYSLNNPFIDRQLSANELYLHSSEYQETLKLSSQSHDYANNESNNILIYRNLATTKFICPESYPYALSYKLVPSESNLWGRGYRNACAFSGGHRAFNDLLYGDNQFVEDNGEYAKLTAFIPFDSVEGCKNDAFMIWLDNKTSFQQINQLNNPQNSVSIGYTAESVSENYVAPKCINYCKNLQRSYCLNLPKDMMYCDNTVSNAYYRKSKYLVRNRQEYFCVCQFKSSSPEYGDYYINQVIDIESVINYLPKLQEVSCTNNSELLKNQ